MKFLLQVKLSVLLTTLCLQVAYGRRVPAVYGQETVQDTMRLEGENPDDNEVSVLPEGKIPKKILVCQLAQIYQLNT